MLLTEEGIAKGVRRLVAITGEDIHAAVSKASISILTGRDAKTAIDKGKELSSKLQEIESANPTVQQEMLNRLKQELDSGPLHATHLPTINRSLFGTQTL